ncbi:MULTISPECIES: DUF7682 family zinc-binding protein [Synechocystis]|uniref:Uncharacterized protein n=1 Tax=Synechocystis salina LEGE 00031 TaxID=1828736 RepID=A0ABR9VSR3_9SYNC|nr:MULTISPECIES: hypothetical protein [Synechocystis]MBD2654286.1 hypothetical protein [Synechocystis sp. FACHB-383]MBE9195043.1 hypothetical protein [Synechocystis sp. LEGE 06083]MBE9240918.1 hypothetical protein [Synechocystis salina LEGE 00041]MBE9254398.1 hypothetical protein [Synechocystis salina LEGE 00031]QUS59446.1 hypothetical protein HTZ78_01285 [Synechocystis sp. PCC 7338]
MARRKKTFPCGHKGYGQECHRCVQKHIDQEERKQSRAAWKATFEEDPIDLTHLPRNVVIKARQILAGLAEQNDYREFYGKRLRHDRLVISIPVTRHYRLICQDDGDRLEPKEIVSHEDYNVCKPGH